MDHRLTHHGPDERAKPLPFPPEKIHETSATLNAIVRKLEAHLINKALKQTAGNKRAAARLLGVKPTTFAAILRRCGIMSQAQSSKVRPPSTFVTSRIKAGVAVRSFPEILNRVHYRRESFVIERGGKPICEISPAAPVGFTGTDLAGLLRSLPPPDQKYLDLVEALAVNQPRVEKSAWRR